MSESAQMKRELVNAIKKLNLTPTGWIRNLIAEGVEPNPGPTWDELLDAITKKFKGGLPKSVGDILSNIYANIVEQQPDLPFVNTDDVLTYLNQLTLQNSTVSERMDKLIRETISSMQLVPPSGSNQAQPLKRTIDLEEIFPGFTNRGAYDFVKKQKLMTSWDFSSIPKVKWEKVNKIYDDERKNFGLLPNEQSDMNLRALVKPVLDAIAPNFGQKIWEEKVQINNREKGKLYPDFASLDASSLLRDDEIDWRELKLLFEVEPNIRKRNTHSLVLATAGEESLGQWMKWVTQLASDMTEAYGAVTNYEYWIFIQARKVDNIWHFYKTGMKGFKGKEGPLFVDPNQSAFGNICNFFAYVQEKKS